MKPLHTLNAPHKEPKIIEIHTSTSGKHLNALDALGSQWGPNIAQKVVKIAKMLNAGPYRSPYGYGIDIKGAKYYSNTYQYLVGT